MKPTPMDLAADRNWQAGYRQGRRSISLRVLAFGFVAWLASRRSPFAVALTFTLVGFGVILVLHYLVWVLVSVGLLAAGSVVRKVRAHRMGRLSPF